MAQKLTTAFHDEMGRMHVAAVHCQNSNGFDA